MTRSTPPLLDLCGTPAAVGAAFGEANAGDIRSEVGAWRGDGRNRDALLRAAGTHRAFLDREAPHWVEEAFGIAGAAGVDPDDYLAYQAAKYRGINRPECFTYFSAPRHNRNGATLFHKNRDNRDRPQSAYLKSLVVPGGRVRRYAATGDTSDTGTMMGLNEDGLAAAADTGAPDPRPRYRGVMNPDLMRLILERAGDVAEAEGMIRRFHAEKVYAGADVATNWMFADRSGRATLIRQFHESLEMRRDEDGMLTMRSDERGALVLATLRREGGRITPGTMNRLSRTPPILSGSNVSGMTAAIPSSRPDLFGWAGFAVCHAGRTVYVPLYLGAIETPRMLVDGTLYRLSKGCPETLGAASDGFEEELEEERTRVEDQARAAVKNGDEEAGRRILTEGCLRLAERAARHLKDAGKRDG